MLKYCYVNFVLKAVIAVFDISIDTSNVSKICDRHDMTEIMLTVAFNTLDP
jgi:hypothetical protein